MPVETKLATCCYCSARTMLKPTARHGHELACGSCGAPLHEMKWLKTPAPVAAHAPHGKLKQKQKRSKPPKRQKSVWERRLKKAWDILEDIID